MFSGGIKREHWGKNGLIDYLLLLLLFPVDTGGKLNVHKTFTVYGV